MTKRETGRPMSRPARSPAARSTHPRSSSGRWRALAALVTTAIVLTGCKVDTEVAVEVDPVCHMKVRATADALAADHQGHQYFFCSKSCLNRFSSTPAAFLPDAG